MIHAKESYIGQNPLVGNKDGFTPPSVTFEVAETPFVVMALRLTERKPLIGAVMRVVMEHMAEAEKTERPPEPVMLIAEDCRQIEMALNEAAAASPDDAHSTPWELFTHNGVIIDPQTAKVLHEPAVTYHRAA